LEGETNESPPCLSFEGTAISIGRLGYEIIVVLGHPNYYPRFGFVPAKPKGIKCEFRVPDEAWMLLELRDRALAGRQGTVRLQREFEDAT